MNKLTETLTHIWNVKDLRNKILFTLLALVIFRLVAQITLPGIDVTQLKALLAQQSNSSNGLLGVFSLLTGGAMENFSLLLMGLTPYINASIIMQLLGVIVPSIEDLKKEGEAGQKKINQYTRLLTIPLAIVQSYGMIVLINRFGYGGELVNTSDWSTMIPMMIMVTAGTVFLMWLGELISEKGLGNGVSIIIFAGIIATVPSQIAGAFQASGLPMILALVGATIALTAFVVYVSEADRRIPVVYASRKSNATQKSFLPLKINQAGMIPIIFAVSVVALPSILSQFFINAESQTLQNIGNFFLNHFNPSSPTIWYNVFYALLIFGFTFFYISITFEPKKIAENIQKRGGYIPGYRPGSETEKFIGQVSSRLAFWGGVFLSFVAIIPILFQNWIAPGGNLALFVSGASMIIIVSVVLDIIRRTNAQLVMHDYNKL